VNIAKAQASMFVPRGAPTSERAATEDRYVDDRQ
jgi:hypothetical protein